MNEIKNIFIILIAFIVWSAVCVGGGYLYSNKISVQLIASERARSAEKDRQYEQSIAVGKERIRELENRISEIRSEVDSEILRSQIGIGNILSILDEIGNQSFVLQEDNGRWYITGGDMLRIVKNKIKE